MSTTSSHHQIGGKLRLAVKAPAVNLIEIVTVDEDFMVGVISYRSIRGVIVSGTVTERRFTFAYLLAISAGVYLELGAIG